tara:strand:- start:1422 stop:2552 length:1131 start_codon:yes stop_codon:yes gene_type:complete
MENFKNKVKEHSGKAAALLYNLQRQEKIKFLALGIIFILIITIVFYIQYKMSLYNKNCNVLQKVYTTRPPLSGINENSPYLLRDFYIKTAYNCCASGQFKADFVGLCALRTCIEQGVRCLDFEIYSIDNQPVVAVSSVNDFTVKESFNSIPIADVFNTIINMAFSASNCPNPTDPLILHFRIMSNNTPMYDTLAKQISSILNSRTLGVDYSFENSGKNLGALPIKNFLNKIIIFADATNPLFQKTKLDEYINMASGTPFMRILPFQEVQFTQDLQLKDFNKKNMTIVLPDWNAHDKNPNFNIARTYGCQMIGMSFQNFDNNLEHYNAFFDGDKSAFVLKPADLRFVPITIKVPPKAPPAYSYQARPVKSDYYNYRI